METQSSIALTSASLPARPASWSTSVRGKSVPQAREILAFCERAAAETVAKTLNSAVANAEHNNHLRGDNLVVKAAYVDEGPTLKRIRPRAKGSASRINKRTCHITIVVAPREEA